MTDGGIEYFMRVRSTPTGALIGARVKGFTSSHRVFG